MDNFHDFIFHDMPPSLVESPWEPAAIAARSTVQTCPGAFLSSMA
jgi:hypothetical protein